MIRKLILMVLAMVLTLAAGWMTAFFILRWEGRVTALAMASGFGPGEVVEYGAEAP